MRGCGILTSSRPLKACSKDKTELLVEVRCSSASNCLDALRIGGDANNAWTVAQISNEFLAVGLQRLALKPCHSIEEPQVHAF